MPDPGDARIAFAGTPEFARIILARLLAAGIRPVLVLTQPDRPTGRGRRLKPSAVKALASDHFLPIAQPASLKVGEGRSALIASKPDLLIVAAYGLILPRSVLTLPACGCVNVHASLLPRWRGAAPVERAIMAGDVVTGVALMQMDAGLDTGGVFAMAACPIAPTSTGAELEAALAQLGGELLVSRLPSLLSGDAGITAQDAAQATYANKLSRDDARIDWHKPAATISRQVRALAGRLSAEAYIGADRVQILRAAATACTFDANAQIGTIVISGSAGIGVRCGSDVLMIHELRITTRGKGTAISASEACNGYAALFALGQSFTTAGTPDESI